MFECPKFGLIADPIDCSTWSLDVTTQYEAYNPDGYCIQGLVQCRDEPLCAFPCNNVTECRDEFDEGTELNCTQYTTCGGPLLATSSEQTFSSENWPNSDYNRYTDCTWVISAPGWYLLKVFNLFRLTHFSHPSQY